MLLPTPKNLAGRLAQAPNRQLPADFKAAVALLKRPYFRLGAQAYALVLSVAGDSDIVLLDGRPMTFGDADGCKALMPLTSGCSAWPGALAASPGDSLWSALPRRTDDPPQ